MELTRFKDRLYNLIEESAKYTYPETNEDFLYPNFKEPVKLESSWMKKRNNYKKAIQNLNKNYNVNGLEETYNNLSDEYSKEMLLMVIVRGLTEEVKVRFPLYYSTVWKNTSRYENFIVSRENQELLGQKLHVYNLKELGYDINLFTSYLGILINFELEQYRYKNEVFIKEGDIVIDGGACFGDTALGFASIVKKNGKIFSFEFMKENLDYFDKNMNMNPEIRDQIELITRPLGINSSEKFYAVEAGPATRLTKDKPKESSTEYTTLSIDDFVEQKNIEKIDFIKLDIEGAELETLKGSIKTIKKHKPNLAICVYHKKSDLWDIPKFLKEVLPEYDLYLDHFTINQWETVLFAKAKK